MAEMSVTHIIKNAVNLESHSDVNGFLRYFADWVRMRFLSTKKADELRRVLHQIHTNAT